MALSYLFMDARGPGGTCQGLGGPQPPNPTNCIFLCPSVLLPFHVGGT